MFIDNAQISPREQIEHDWYAEEARLAREHAALMKRLDLEEQKLEAKWNNWLKIPITIIKLPIYLVLGLGVVVAYIRGIHPSHELLAMLNGQRVNKEDAKTNTQPNTQPNSDERPAD